MGLLTMLVACLGQAADFPSKPITLYCGMSAGNPADVEARLLASEVKEILGQPVVVQNLPGSSGAKAYTAVNKAKGDGYSLSTTTFTFPVHSASHTLPFSHKDFKYVAGISGDPIILIAPENSPIKNLDDFVKAGKNPDKPLTVGISTPGSGLDMAARMLKDRLGVNLRIVAHKEGPSQVSAAVAGNHLDLGVSNASASYSLLKSGKIRILGVLNDKRLESFPEYPTFKESGLDVPDMLIARMIVAPKDTPDPIIEKLHAAFTKAKASPRYSEYLKSHSGDPMNMSPAECEAFIDGQVKLITPIIEELGMVKK